MDRLKMELNQKGLTLVELLVSIFVSALILTGAVQLFGTHNMIAARQEENSLMEQELLNAMTQIAQELRMCGYSPQGGSFGFANPGTNGRGLNATALYFTWDRNEDAAVDENSTETVGYRLNVDASGNTISPAPNTMSRYMNGVWRVASSNIGAVNFSYLSENGTNISNPAANISDIRSVSVVLTGVASTARSGLGIANRTMTSTFYCRNVHD